jgi:hypothetical protein
VESLAALVQKLLSNSFLQVLDPLVSSFRYSPLISSFIAAIFDFHDYARTQLRTS